MLFPEDQELLGVAVYGGTALVFAVWTLGPVVAYVMGCHWTHDTTSAEGDERWADPQVSPFADTERVLMRLGFRPGIEVRRREFCYFGHWWSDKKIHVFVADEIFAEVYRLHLGDRVRVGLTTLFEDGVAIATSLMSEATSDGAKYKIRGQPYGSPREMLDAHRAWVASLVEQGKRPARGSIAEIYRRARYIEYGSEIVLDSQHSSNMDRPKIYFGLFVASLLYFSLRYSDPASIKVVAALAAAGGILSAMLFLRWAGPALDEWAKHGKKI